MYTIIDLTGLDSNAYSGVNQFSIDLTKSLLRSGVRKYKVLLSTENHARFRSELMTVSPDIIIIDTSIPRWVKAIIAVTGYITRNFKVRIAYDKYFRRRLGKKISALGNTLICPSTILNHMALKLPCIVCVHDIQHEDVPSNFSWLSYISRWGQYRASCYAATVVQISSSFVEDSLLRHFDFIDARKIVKIPEGVRVERFYHEINTPNNNNLKSLLYPAQLWPHKNHLSLIAALQYIKNKTGDDLKCFMTGGDKGMGVMIRAGIEAARLENCKLMGLVTDAQLLSLYRESLIVLALGSYESSSLPIKEAAASRKLVVASDIQPNRDLSNTLDIFLVDPADPISIGDAIISILNTSQCELDQIREENYYKVLKFDWDLIATEYEQVLVGMDIC